MFMVSEISRFTKIGLTAFLVAIIALLSVGCKERTDESIPSDPHDVYYSSQIYDLEMPGYQFRTLVGLKDKQIVLFDKYNENSGLECVLFTHEEGEGKWDNKVTLDTGGQMIYSFCRAGDNTLAAGTAYGFIIFDADSGKQICRNDDLYVYLDGAFPNVAYVEGGFVLVTSDTIYKISDSGEVLATVQYDFDCELADDISFFGCDDKYILIAGNFPTDYYEVDFDSGEVKYLCNVRELGLEDYYVYRMGGYANDRGKGIIYKLDPANTTKKEIAYIDNMLIRPMKYFSGFDPLWYVLDDGSIAVLYQYGQGLNEVVLVKPDPDSDLKDRTVLTVRGYSARSDSILNTAAYIYNSSQDKFMVKIEDYDSSLYGYTTAKDAQESKLKLLQEFSNGNTPDIFYGDGFDYAQMGRNGLTKDLSGYLKDNEVINSETVSKNIYDMYFDGDRCYQLFPAYTMYGLWSNDRFTGGNNSMTLDDLASAQYSQRIFDDRYASDIADFAIRYPISKLIRNGEFISEDELEKIISFAVDNGMAPDAEIKYIADRGSVDAGNYAVYCRIIGNIKSFVQEQGESDDKTSFVGFPTIGGSVHTCMPLSLLSVSENTQYPEECMKFIELLYSDEVQKVALTTGGIPVKNTIYDEVLDIALDQSKIGDDVYYRMFFDSDDSRIPAKYSMEVVEGFRKATEAIDTVNVTDWGLYNIIAEEINSYYLQHKDIKDIAHSMRSRIKLYIEENGVH